MLRSIAKVLLPGLLLPCLIALATPATAQHSSSAITIDASRLDDVFTLPGLVAFSPADDPRFADPTFDDSSWPRLKPGQNIPPADLNGASKNYAWVRIHLHIVNAHGPLAIAITHGFYSYAVYANGLQIGASAGMPTNVGQADPPFAIALPSAPDITLAIRFKHSNPLFVLPLGRLQIGYESAVTDATDLAHIRDLDLHYVATLILNLTLFAFAAFFLVLYLAQRQHSEYLWLALFCVCLSAFNVTEQAISAGTIPLTNSTAIAGNFLGYCSGVCALEFVIRFLQAKAHWPVRLLEVIFLLGLLAPSVFPSLGSFYPVLATVLASVAFSYYLIRAYRSGSFENKLLLPNFALIFAVSGWGFLSRVVPQVHFPAPFRVGHFGFDLGDLASFIFAIAMLAVVLYRFIRVTRDEQRAAAELEAARTVQQILIPETLPTIPGYTIASVYQPAQEVGGDFFQIIPLPSAAALIILGDVSGKGMQAAMTVSLLVGALRAAAETSTSPAQLLANLNRRLHGRGTGFTTCLILHLSADGNLTAANAGHLQPYLDGHELALEPGLPLGFIPDATYVESHLSIAPEQTITLVTDGVVEATSPTKELFGFDRTQSISRQSAHDIAAAATAFGAPAPQADDITVLTLHRLPA